MAILVIMQNDIALTTDHTEIPLVNIIWTSTVKCNTSRLEQNYSTTDNL